MRIMRIIARLNTGGPAIQAIELSTELARRGHECLLVAGHVPANEQNDLERRMIVETMRNRYDYKFCPDLQRGPNFKKDKAAFLWLRERMEQFCPDVVHTHTAKAGLLGRLAALTIRPRPRLVHTFHGHVFHSYFGRCKAWFYLQMERWLSRFTDAVVAISPVLEKELAGYGIKNLKLVPLGFDLSRFLNIRPFAYDPAKRLHIGIVGRLTAIKNHELFLDFMAKMMTVLPVAGWVIGQGERENEIRQMIVAGQLPIEIMAVDHADMHEIYKSLDIVVCTSKNEGTPVSLIEAMAAGKLVVSTRVGGCKDLLGLGKRRRGISLYPNRAERTVGELMDLFNTGKYKTIIDNARSHVVREYQLARLVLDIENLYEEVLEK